MAASDRSAVQWRPIAYLPVIARLIDDELEDAEKHHASLLEARPGALDDRIVERVLRVYTDAQGFLGIYEEHRGGARIH